MKNEDEFMLIDVSTGKTHGNYSNLGAAADVMHRLSERDHKAKFVVAHVLIKQVGIKFSNQARTASEKPIDKANLAALEESMTDLVSTIEAIKQVASTQPGLVPTLLTTVQQALTGMAGELHSLGSDNA